jgi:hypothetical protein
LLRAQNFNHLRADLSAPNGLDAACCVGKIRAPNKKGDPQAAF